MLQAVYMENQLHINTLKFVKYSNISNQLQHMLTTGSDWQKIRIVLRQEGGGR